MAVPRPRQRWIQLIDSQQSVIQLNDRLIYEVRPGDRQVVRNWSPPEFVEVVEAPGNRKYPRRLKNRDRGESVRIRRSKVPPRQAAR